MTEVADFEASRQAALTQRMRYAKAQGQVPMWPVASGVEMPPEETMQPLAQQQYSEADEEKKKPAAGVDAPAASIMSQASLTIGVLAILVAIVLGIRFLTHRATYDYK